MNDIFEKVDEMSGRILEPAAKPLEAAELRDAVHLVKPLWKTVARVKCDPVIREQEYGLISFTPARGVQPNQFGIYGVAKLRGNYKSSEEAANAAESIVREIDSCNEIYTVKVGQSFPLSKDVKFVSEFSSIDLSKEVTTEEKLRVQSEQKKEKREKKKILDRERKLLEEHKQILEDSYEEDPLDVYIRARVKMAQLKYTLEITQKKIQEEIKPALQKSIEDLSELDVKYPGIKDEYMKHYLDARAESGLTTEFNTETGSQLDFMKYLND